jgi:murein DD-endopeptidase MepM/ murein hydrolase activator NlpD
MSALSGAGMLHVMDFQFHLSRLLRENERLSADAVLEPGEVYLNSGLYAAAPSLPDAARIVVEGPRGDLGEVTVPVSRRQSANRYRAPVDGRWFVVASADAGHHHRWVVSSEYALDLARLGADMRSFSGDGTRLDQYVTFGQPVLAAADGVVVAARGDRVDNEAMLRQPDEAFDAYMARVQEMQQGIIMSEGFEGAAGNYVLIRHEGGEHSLYAHMRQASIAVAAGDVVRAGQRIGEAGSSGNSTEPHLHFQLIDGPDLNSARGLPVVFENLREEWVPIGERQLRAGDVLEPAS